jgi:putative endonuclease
VDGTDITLRQKQWFVYLIECTDGSIYTGIAINVAARYAAHLSGKGARYTRSHPPLHLLASETHPDRSAALKAELRIKQLTATQKRAYVEKLQLNALNRAGGFSNAAES